MKLPLRLLTLFVPLLLAACSMSSQSRSLSTLTPSPSNTPKANTTISLGTFSLSPKPTLTPQPISTLPPNSQPPPTPGICQGGSYFGCHGIDNCDCTLDHCYCQDGKPVIYLYPEKPTAISVKLILNGWVTTSIPRYPTEGWHVLAQPDGTLWTQGQPYSELFYEATALAFTKPITGFVIAKTELATKLKDYVMQLGLTDKESQEFLAWWVPKLAALKSPYIFFSVFPTIEKEKFDHASITPQPDVFISFIVYFRPVDGLTTPAPLYFPPTPKRHGFTAVQWGGILDN